MSEIKLRTDKETLWWLGQCRGDNCTYHANEATAQAIHHDLALIHANHARWVADSAWRAKIEPLVKEWRGARKLSQEALFRFEYGGGATPTECRVTTDNLKSCEEALAAAVDGLEGEACPKCGGKRQIIVEPYPLQLEARTCDHCHGTGEENQP